jgi:hypothetical protein
MKGSLTCIRHVLLECVNGAVSGKKGTQLEREEGYLRNSGQANYSSKIACITRHRNLSNKGWNEKFQNPRIHPPDPISVTQRPVWCN